MGMDLAALTPLEDAQDMTVTHPETGDPILDDQGKPVTIWLFGQDSEQYKRVTRSNAHRLQMMGRRTRKKYLTHEQLDQLESDALETVIACTVRWTGVVFGGPLECTPSNARRLYTALPWLREQAEQFILERENFLGNSKKSSSPSPSINSGSAAP